MLPRALPAFRQLKQRNRSRRAEQPDDGRGATRLLFQPAGSGDDVGPRQGDTDPATRRLHALRTPDTAAYPGGYACPLPPTCARVLRAVLFVLLPLFVAVSVTPAPLNRAHTRYTCCSCAAVHELVNTCTAHNVLAPHRVCVTGILVPNTHAVETAVLLAAYKYRKPVPAPSPLQPPQLPWMTGAH